MLNSQVSIQPNSLLACLQQSSFFNYIKRELSRIYELLIVEKIAFGITEKKFYTALGGHILFETLFAAVEFDLFNLIQKNQKLSLKNIAEKLKINEQACRIMLLGLTTQGFLKIKNNNYQNTVLARRYLLNNSPWKYSSCIKWQHYINYKALYHFHSALKANSNVGIIEIAGTGKTLYQRLQENPELEKLFQDAMQEISQQSNQLLPKYLNLNKVKHLVDVGGGNGTNVIALTLRYPLLRASVYDSSTVCEIAKLNFIKQNHKDRLDTIVGNIFEDQLPATADCFLFCHFFTIWSKAENLMLLKKAYESLPEGGRVVIFNMMQHNTQDGPLTAAIGSPYFLTLATGTGMLYTWNEYKELFKEAGFKKVTTIKLPRDHGLIIGVK
jgi:hypothetical protein